MKDSLECWTIEYHMEKKYEETHQTGTLRNGEPGNKFEQLQEKSEYLLADAQNAIASGENRMRSVGELQNEPASDGMAKACTKIAALEEQLGGIRKVAKRIDNFVKGFRGDGTGDDKALVVIRWHSSRLNKIAQVDSRVRKR